MATAADGDLILKLYDLRREPRMRQARQWVMQEFKPKNLDELLAVQRDFGSDQNQMWRQVIGYWEMAAALVLHGALDRELFFDSVGENVFLLAKFGRLHEEYAKMAGNDGFMPHTSKLIDGYEPAMRRVRELRSFLDRE
ncbi:MAG TPA: hypothetical protein VMD97_04410 [Candidatus Aquilonibacter sp.]|nr:hypothetical protein [Candidatus Aquilonibacter sp.]